ncbi:hypothetical protein [Bariatricus sp. HCP28S3_D3]|uniref:hypothetical protein n=1 Tax=Bariatricus sp. HCP28S3_D3 TaxID=3438901 RepID=UPI003F894BAB
MRDNITNSTISTGRGKEATSVDREKMRKQRYKKVNTGKGKKVGFFESIGLKIKGFCDGRKGFPRQTDKYDWYSPFMNQEVNSFEEFCSHTWGSLQIENEGEYARMEELMDGILQKKELLEAARDDFAVATKRENDSESTRKKGEDKLTDTQTRTRRKAEKEKKLAPLKSKVAGLEQELKDAEEAFSDLHSKLVEDDNTTRLICHRVRDHILMRLDVYWNSAIRRHPDGASMPVVPVLELKDEAEEAYFRPHKEMMKRAAAIHDAIRDEAAEKEVA